LYDWVYALHEQGQVATQHDMLNHTCEIDGDLAHSETNYLFVGRNRDENGVIARGPDDISYLRPLVNGRGERVPGPTED